MSYTCDKCSYLTYRKYNLNKHIRSKKHSINIKKKEEEETLSREQKKHFVCPKCGKRFMNNRDLIRHVNKSNSCIKIESSEVVEPNKPQYVYLIRERTAVVAQQMIRMD